MEAMSISSKQGDYLFKVGRSAQQGRAARRVARPLALRCKFDGYSIRLAVLKVNSVSHLMYTFHKTLIEYGQSVGEQPGVEQLNCSDVIGGG